MATPIRSIGPYQTLGTLGRGAHSTIFHIRRTADAKPYALKTVAVTEPEHQKFLEQAKHEFRVGQRLEHSYLIKIHALEFERDWFWRIKKANMLIEYVNGKTLDGYKSIALAKLVQTFGRVAAGMVYMHSQGVIHADLKPNNILLSPAGAVKIIDYGLAWVDGEDKDRIQGTPEYIAPETAMRREVSERSDIYNLGATMYRLVTGKLPPRFAQKAGALPMDAPMFKKLFKPVEELVPSTPPELCALIHQCLEYYPVNRPGKMKDVQKALVKIAEALVDDEPEDAGFEA